MTLPQNTPTFRQALQFFLYETRPTWLTDDGTISYEELAKAVEEWLIALPVERRMEAMGMEATPAGDTRMWPAELIVWTPTDALADWWKENPDA